MLRNIIVTFIIIFYVFTYLFNNFIIDAYTHTIFYSLLIHDDRILPDCTLMDEQLLTKMYRIYVATLLTKMFYPHQATINCL